jgi:hypothetical protein
MLRAAGALEGVNRAANAKAASSLRSIVAWSGVPAALNFLGRRSI